MDTEKIRFMAEFIEESEAIENYERERSLLEQQLREEKLDGHVGALRLADSLGMRNVKIGKGHLCAMQRLIIEEQGLLLDTALYPGLLGEYRKVHMRFGKDICPPPGHVSSLTADFIGALRNWLENSKHYSREARVRKIALFHSNFLKIHPFGDGNGRTARVLAYYLYRFCRMEPFVFTSADKNETYYAAFDDPSGHAIQNYFVARTSFARKAA